MQSSPWSAARTLLVLGTALTLLVYAFLGTSSSFSCRKNRAGTQNCTLTRYFLFENDPMAGVFNGVHLGWDDPLTGKTLYAITLESRDGEGTMPSIGASGWKAFLQAQISAFTQFPWQYIWRGIVFNRNILLTLTSFFGIFWALLLFSTLRGHDLQ